jgi:hypothetical protein
LSLTLAELVERTGDGPELLRHVLGEEVACGRVAWTADGYTLDKACFPRDVLAGLQTLSWLRPIDVADELTISGAEDAG